jgi:hypothetical protein
LTKTLTACRIALSNESADDARIAYAKRIDRLDPERYSTVNEHRVKTRLAACLELLTPKSDQETLRATALREKTARRHGTGGADRVRTDDLRLAKPALSQLSYSPQSR